MSGRKSKKSQKFGSSRRNASRGHNRDTEDKESEDANLQTGYEEHKNQQAGDASMLQSGQAESTSSSQQTSASELLIQSQDGKELLAQAEAVSKKRKMGTTRRSRRFKGDEVPEEEPEHIEEHKVTEEVSVEEEGSKKDYDQQVPPDFSSCQSTKPESSTLQSEQISIASHEPDQLEVVGFCSESASHSLVFSVVKSTENELPAHEISTSLQMYHQTETLPPTTGLKSRKDSADRPPNENWNNRESENPCTSESISEVLDPYWNVYPDEARSIVQPIEPDENITLSPEQKHLEDRSSDQHLSYTSEVPCDFSSSESSHPSDARPLKEESSIVDNTEKMEAGFKEHDNEEDKETRTESAAMASLNLIIEKSKIPYEIVCEVESEKMGIKNQLYVLTNNDSGELASELDSRRREDVFPNLYLGSNELHDSKHYQETRFYDKTPFQLNDEKRGGDTAENKNQDVFEEIKPSENTSDTSTLPVREEESNIYYDTDETLEVTKTNVDVLKRTEISIENITLVYGSKDGLNEDRVHTAEVLTTDHIMKPAETIELYLAEQLQASTACTEEDTEKDIKYKYLEEEEDGVQCLSTLAKEDDKDNADQTGEKYRTGFQTYSSEPEGYTTSHLSQDSIEVTNALVTNSTPKLSEIECNTSSWFPQENWLDSCNTLKERKDHGLEDETEKDVATKKIKISQEYDETATTLFVCEENEGIGQDLNTNPKCGVLGSEGMEKGFLDVTEYQIESNLQKWELQENSELKNKEVYTESQTTPQGKHRADNEEEERTFEDTEATDEIEHDSEKRGFKETIHQAAAVNLLTDPQNDVSVVSLSIIDQPYDEKTIESKQAKEGHGMIDTLPSTMASNVIVHQIDRVLLSEGTKAERLVEMKKHGSPVVDDEKCDDSTSSDDQKISPIITEVQNDTSTYHDSSQETCMVVDEYKRENRGHSQIHLNTIKEILAMEGARGKEDDEERYGEDNVVYLTDRSNISGTKTEVIEEERVEAKEEMNATPTEESTTEDFMAVCSEHVLSEVSSQTTELNFTTNTQPSAEPEHTDSKEVGESNNENAEIRRTELHPQSQSKKKGKFGSTRRPHGGHRPDNEGREKTGKDTEETTHQEVTTDLLSESQGDVSELSLGVLDPLLEKEAIESTDETRDSEMTDTSHATLTDVHHIDHEVNNMEEQIEITDVHGKSVVDDEKIDDSTSSDEQKIPPIITDIQSDTSTHRDSSQETSMVVEEHDKESIVNGNNVHASPPSGTMELIPETQEGDIPVITENSDEVAPEQIRQLTWDHNASEDHQEKPADRESESTTSLIHTQESDTTEENVITEKSALSTSGKRRKIGSTRRSHREKLHGGDRKKMNETEENQDENDDEEKYREENDVYLTDRSNMSDTQTEVIEEESMEAKVELDVTPAGEFITEDFMAVSSEQHVLSEVSSQSTELSLTTNTQPSAVSRNSDTNEVSESNYDNLEIKSTELHPQSQSQKKRKFGSTRRPHGGNRPDNEGGERTEKDTEATEEIEHDVEERCSKETTDQEVTTDLLSESQGDVSELSLGVLDPLLEKEAIESTDETRESEITDTSHATLTDVHHIDHEVNNMEEQIEITDVHGKSVVDDEKIDDSTSSDEQKIPPIITDIQSDTSTHHDSSQETCMVVEEHDKENDVSRNYVHASPPSGTMELIPETQDGDIPVITENSDEVAPEQIRQLTWGHNASEDHQEKPADRESESTISLIHTQESDTTEENVITEKSALSTSGKRRKIGSTRRSHREKLHGGDKKKMNETEENQDENDDERHGEDSDELLLDRSNMSDTQTEVTEEESLEPKTTLTEESTTEDLIAVCSEQHVLSEVSSQTVEICFTTNTQPSPETEQTDTKEVDESNYDNVEIKSTELHPQSQSRKKGKFGSTRRPHGGHRPDNEGGERTGKDTEATEEIEHDVEERCSKETTDQEVTTDLLSESQGDVSELSLGVLDPLLEKEAIESTDETRESEITDTSHATLTDVHHIDHEVNNMEEQIEITDVHGKSVVDDEKIDDSTSSDEQKIPPIITDIQSDTSTHHDSSQETSMVVEEHDKESTVSENYIHASPPSGTMEIIPETQDGDIPVITENSDEVAPEQIRQLTWGHNASEDHQEKPADRESESTTSLIHTQESDTTEENVITEKSALSTSGKRRKIGSTRRSHREKLHGGDKKKMNETEENQDENDDERHGEDSDELLLDRSNMSDTQTEVTEEESLEPKTTLTEESTTEDLIAVCSEQHVLSEVSSQTVEICFTTNTQPSPETEQTDTKEVDESNNENAEIKSTELHPQSQSRKKGKFGSTRRPHGGHRPDNEGGERTEKDTEATEEIEHDVEERCSKETTDQEVTTDLLSESQGDVSELSLGVLDPLLEKEAIESTDETRESEITDTSHATLTDVHHIDHEVNNMEEQIEITDVHGKSVVDDEKIDDSTSSDEQKIPPIITDIQSDTSTHHYSSQETSMEVEEHDKESTVNGNNVHASPPSGTMELIPETQEGDIPVITENSDEVAPEQIRQLTWDHNASEDHQEKPADRESESTTSLIHTQESDTTEENVITEKSALSTSGKRRKIGSTRRSHREKLHGGDRKKMNETEENQDENDDEEKYREENDVYLTDRSNMSDTQTEVIEEESMEAKVELDATPAGEFITEDFMAVSSEQHVLSEVSSQSTELSLTTNAQPSAVSRNSDTNEVSESNYDNLEIKSTELHPQSQSRKKGKFGSTRRPHGGHRPDNEGGERTGKDTEATEETEHDVEERCSKETTDQEVTTDLLSESQGDVSELSLGVLDPLLEKEAIESTDETRESEITDTSHATLTDVHHIDHEVNNMEEQIEITDVHGKSVVDDEKIDDSTSSDEQKIPPIITDIQSDTSTHHDSSQETSMVVEEHDKKSTVSENYVHASPPSGTMEIIPETQDGDIPVITENSDEVAPEQKRQLTWDHNASEDHHEKPTDRESESTTSLIHTQESDTTEENVITEKSALSTSGKRRKIGSTRRSHREKLHGGDKKKMNETEENQDENDDERYGEDSDELLLDRSNMSDTQTEVTEEESLEPKTTLTEESTTEDLIAVCSEQHVLSEVSSQTVEICFTTNTQPSPETEQTDTKEVGESNNENAEIKSTELHPQSQSRKKRKFGSTRRPHGGHRPDNEGGERTEKDTEATEETQHDVEERCSKETTDQEVTTDLLSESQGDVSELSLGILDPLLEKEAIESTDETEECEITDTSHATLTDVHHIDHEVNNMEEQIEITDVHGKSVVDEEKIDDSTSSDEQKIPPIITDIQSDTSTHHDSSQETYMVVEEHDKESTVNGNYIHASPPSGTMELIPETQDSDIPVITENSDEVAPEQIRQLTWDHNTSEDHQEKPTDRESESTTSLIHTQESDTTEENVITEKSALSTSGKRRKIGSTRRSHREKLHGGDKKKTNETEENQDENDDEEKYREENDVYLTDRSNMSDTQTEVIEEESMEAKEELDATPAGEFTTEDFMAVCSEQHVLSEVSSQSTELSLTTNTQPSAVSRNSDTEEVNESNYDNVEIKSTELHPQSQSQKKRKFGSTRRPHGGHRPDNEGGERTEKDTEATEEIEHDVEERCSKETTHQEVSTDWLSESHGDVSELSLGIIVPPLEKEVIESTGEIEECGMINMPSVTIDIQRDTSTHHDSSEDTSRVVEEHDKESSVNGNYVHASPPSGTMELIPETQDGDIPVIAEYSHEVALEQIRQLTWDHNASEDHQEKPADRESKSTTSFIHTQESDTTEENVITEKSALSTSGKRRKIGSTRRSHREKLHGGDKKKMNETEENQDENDDEEKYREENDVYLTDRSNMSDTQTEVIEEESMEAKEELDATPAGEFTTEDFMAVCSEQHVLSTVSSQTVEICFTTNTQPSPETEQTDTKEVGESNNENAEIKSTELHPQSQSRKKGKFGSTRRPHGGHRPDNEGGERTGKDTEATEETEHDVEERCSKETTDQEVTTDLLSESQGDVSELSLGILDPLLEKEAIESKDETGECEITDTSHATLTDVHHIDHEVNNMEEQIEITDVHGKSVVDDEKIDDSTSSDEQKIPTIITDIQSDTSTHHDSSQETSMVVEEHDKESTVNGNNVHASPPSGTMELIPETQEGDIPVITEYSDEVAPEQIRQLTWDHNASEDHQEKPADRESESTTSLIHTQESDTTEENVITEKSALSTSGKRRKIGSTRRSHREKLHGGDKKKMHQTQENQDENDDEEKYREENDVYLTDRSNMSDTQTEVIEEESMETKEELDATPAGEFTTEVSSQSTELSLTTNTQPSAASRNSDTKEVNESNYDNVEIKSTELHPQSQSQKKRKFGSTRRPHGGHRPDNEGGERTEKDTEATEEIEHDVEERCSKETTHQEVSTDWLSESQGDVSELSLGIIVPPLEKEVIESTGEIEECGMINMPSVTIDIQRDTSTHHDSSQDTSRVVEEHDKESSVNGNYVHASPPSGTMELIPETQDGDIPVIAENSHEVAPEEIRQLTWDHNASEDHQEKPADREPESTTSFIHTQESDTTEENVITEKSALSTSGKKRKIGSTRRSHREKLHGGDKKKMNETEENQDKNDDERHGEDSDELLLDRSNMSDTQTEDTEEESLEPKNTLTEESTTEDLIAVCSEQHVLSEVSSQTAEICFTTNTQPSPETEQTDTKEVGESNNENAEIKSTELHPQSQSRKKGKFGSTRRPHGGHRPDNEGGERTGKDTEATEEIEHDVEERCSKETTDQEVTTDLLSESQGDVSELSLGVLDPLLEKDVVESKDETGESEMVNVPFVTLTDIVVHNIDHEVSNSKGVGENIEGHRKSVLNKKTDDSTSSDEQKMPQIMTEIQIATHTFYDSSQELSLMAEESDEKSSVNGNYVHASPPSGTMELIPETQDGDIPVIAEYSHEVAPEQIRQLTWDHNASEDHQEKLADRESESTTSLIHTQESDTTEENVITEKSALSTSGKRRKIGSTRRSHREKLHGGDRKKMNETEENQDEKDEEEKYREENDVYLTDRSNMSDTQTEVTEEESMVPKTPPTGESTTEDLIAVCSEQHVLSEVSSQTTALSFISNRQPSPEPEHTDSKEVGESNNENVEIRKTELHPQSQSKKKRKFGSTRRPHGGNRPDNEGGERTWKDTEATEETEHDVEEICSKETSDQEVTADWVSGSQTDVSELSLGIIVPLLEKEVIESTGEIEECGMIDMPSVTTDIQSDTSTHHDSSQETSMVVEEHDKVNAVSRNYVHASQPSGTMELIPETQDSDIPVITENSDEVAPEQIRQLTWDHNASEDHQEKPTDRESESTTSLIHTQESDTTEENVITEKSALSTSGKRRKIGSTRRSHREKLHGGDKKKMNETEENQDQNDDEEKYREENDVYLIDRSIMSDTQTEVIEEESMEAKEELDATPAGEFITEDFMAVCSEQHVLSEVSSQSTQVSLTSNTQPLAVSRKSDTNDVGESNYDNVEIKSTELHPQSQSQKKRKFGSTRRPHGGHRPDNEGGERTEKDTEATKEIEHDVAEGCSKETTDQEVTTDLLSESQTDVSELSLGIKIESKDEPVECERIDTSDVTDVVLSVGHEVSKAEGPVEITEVHGISQSIQNVTANNSELSTSGKRRKIGSTRRNPRELRFRDDQVDTTEELKENNNTKEQELYEIPPITKEALSETETLNLIPAFNAETSHHSIIEPSESISIVRPEVGKLDKKKRKMGSTRKNFKGGESKEALEETRDMDPRINEDIVTEETKWTTTTMEDTLLHDTAFGLRTTAETTVQVNKPPIHHMLDQSEGSLLSEIECELKMSCQLNITAGAISESSSNNALETCNNQYHLSDIPEPAAEQCKSTLELPTSQTSQTHTEPSSPGRRRKMGSTRKTQRNKHTEEIKNESIETEHQEENFTKIELETETEKAKDTLGIHITEDTKGSVDITSKVHPDSQIDENNAASTQPPFPEGRRKFGSRRTAKGSRNLSGLPPDEFEPNQEDVPSVRDPYFRPGPQSTAISDCNTEASQGNEHVSTVAGLVSLDDLRKSALYNGSTGKREKIDFERWTEQIPDFGVAVYNVVMVGNSNVGKTSFIKRFQSGLFSLDYSSTIGVDTCVQTITLGNRTVKLHVWDTAGQERYHSITRQVFHKAQGLLLMYDITCSESFCAVRNWISQIKENAPDDVIMMLLGNKNDSAGRKVQLQEGEDLSREYKIHFMECSAATGENVAESMKTLACLLVKQNVRREEEQTILQPRKPQQKSGCC
ncbi:uncharacterized protein rab44 [Salminus brasiliensis]|uniref:uncharacterized protein rab44 n=1 Tax=Salminus brasiliensis TaxID=930266 RepID=UPI003B835C27